MSTASYGTAQWLPSTPKPRRIAHCQQPDNTSCDGVEALAAVLGGTNSLHTNALDEVLALPSERAAEIALRTQQVLLEETGVVNVGDPLGGSWYVEELTDRLEAEAETIFASIRTMSSDGTMVAGILRGIEDGWFMAEIAESAFRYQRRWRRATRRRRRQRPCRHGRDAAGDPAGVAEVSRSKTVRSLASGHARSGRCEQCARRMREVARGTENLVRRCWTLLGSRPRWANLRRPHAGGALHRAAALLAASTHPRSDQLRRREG